MKYKSRAISLTYIKQGESSIISKILTEEKGLQTFIIKGVRSKKSQKKISYFEPLKLIDIDAEFKYKNSLQYLKDITIVENFDNPKNKISKHFIAFFSAEVASRVLQENEKNLELFNFLWHTSYSLYKNEKIDPNFALNYLLNLSSFLGFYPSKTKKNMPFFNMENGEFSEKKGLQNISLDKEKSDYLKLLLENQYVSINQKKKTELLKDLLRYYKLHHYNLDNIKSHLVIESLRR
tara:strand:- start:257 stop:964 length:708 start_codon:yes stop_codon:yes gene_type:complete